MQYVIIIRLIKLLNQMARTWTVVGAHIAFSGTILDRCECNETISNKTFLLMTVKDLTAM